MILILYIFQSKVQKKQDAFEKLLLQLPEDMQISILRYKRSEDRWSHLLGKLLIKKGCSYFRIDGESILRKITYTPFKRPFIPGSILDFNVSHSGECVICAMSPSCRLGIDVEQIKTISIYDFYRSMQEEEKARVYTSENILMTFYQYWTEKESVLKADGKGLQVPLKNFIVKDKHVIVENTNWFLKEITLREDYVCNLATDERGKELETYLHEVVF